MKEQFKSYMQTFNTNHVYRAILVDKNSEAQRRYEMSQAALKPEEGTPIKLQKIEDLVYGVSDPYMSVNNDYFKVYDTPLSSNTFNQLILLKILASVIRKQGHNKITESTLDKLVPGLNVNQLVKQFGKSDNIKIKPEDDGCTIDLGIYMQISIEGPGSIKYNVNEELINRVYDVISNP